MTNLWAKMYDTDGDGNLEVLQLSEDDPTTLFTPEACEHWFEVPDGTTIGSVLENSTKTWWTGGDWLDRKIANSPAATNEGEDGYVPAAPSLMSGAVTALSITSPGDNYDDASVRNQYNIGEGQGLVAEVLYNQATGQATSVTIHNGGWGYTVGQTFNVESGMNMLAWDRKNPTYTVVTVTAIHTE
jgi:hypothetical protein